MYFKNLVLNLVEILFTLSSCRCRCPPYKDPVYDIQNRVVGGIFSERF